jgi:hypothetical protein
MHYKPFLDHLDPIMVESPLVVLCLADSTLVEVRWHVLLMRFRNFYNLVREWNVENLNS